MTDKTIDGWLVVDWKKEKTRTRKSKPSASELGTNELLAKLNIDVSVPEVDVPTLALEIDVPEPQVFAATLEAIDDEDLPDWSEAAIESIDAARQSFEDADSHAEFQNVVDSVVVRTLQSTPGRPDVETVRDFVVRTANDLDDDGRIEGVVE